MEFVLSNIKLDNWVKATSEAREDLKERADCWAEYDGLEYDPNLQLVISAKISNKKADDWHFVNYSSEEHLYTYACYKGEWSFYDIIFDEDGDVMCYSKVEHQGCIDIIAWAPMPLINVVYQFEPFKES